MKVISLFVALLASVSMACASGTHEGGHHTNEQNVHWTAPKKAIEQVNPVAVDSNSISNGFKIFTELCARCHGDQGLGDGPDGSGLSVKPTNLKAMAGGHPEGDFAWKIKNGRGEMPAWDDELEEKEIWYLVNYIQSLSGHPDSEKSMHEQTHN
jgi:mono/diheme cytochrome c family protein